MLPSVVSDAAARLWHNRGLRLTPGRLLPLNRHYGRGREIFLVGPLLILLAWFAADQWDSASPATRAWLQFTGVVCAASLIPLPGAWSLEHVGRRVNWWGWGVVIALLAVS
jgi:hypothetical protein